MNKKQLVDSISSSCGISKVDATKAVNAAVESIVGALRRGEDVQLMGLGTFRTKVRKAREGRNPQTGKPIKIEEKRVAHFKPGKAVLDELN